MTEGAKLFQAGKQRLRKDAAAVVWCLRVCREKMKPGIPQRYAVTDNSWKLCSRKFQFP